MRQALLSALQELETDHQFLADLFGGIRAVALPCEPDSRPCDSTDCPQGAACSRLVREQFHRSMYAVVGHFGREDRIIRDLLSPSAFQAHTEQHADLSAQMQVAIIRFSESRNAKAARVDLLAVATAIEQHQAEQDDSFLLLLPGHPRHTVRHAVAAAPGRTDPALPLPLTGHALIDAEHRQLYDIVRRSQTLCCTGQAHCGDCSATMRHACNEQAVDLITDALKCMVEHFRREDVLLREQIPSDRITAHLDSHAELSQRLSQLVGDYEDSNTALCLFRLGDILQHWLHDHITRHDQPCFGHNAATAPISVSGAQLPMPASILEAGPLVQAFA